MNSSARDRGLPREPIHRLTEPMARFLRVEAAGGVVLILGTAIALLAVLRRRRAAAVGS